MRRLEYEIAALKAELRSSEQRAAAAEARAEAAERRLRDGQARQPYDKPHGTRDTANRIGCAAAHAAGEVWVQGESSRAAAGTRSASPPLETTCAPAWSACVAQPETSAVSAVAPHSGRPFDVDTRVASAEARPIAARDLSAQIIATTSSWTGSAGSSSRVPLHDFHPQVTPSRLWTAGYDDMVPPPTPMQSEPHPHAAAMDSGTEAQRALQTQLQEQCHLLSQWHDEMRDSVIALQVESSTWRRQQAQYLAERQEWEAEQEARYAESAAAEDTQLRLANARAKAIIRSAQGGEAVKGAEAAAPAWRGGRCQTPASPPSASGSSSAAGTPVRRAQCGYAGQLAAGRDALARRRQERIEAMIGHSEENLIQDRQRGVEEERLSASSPARGEPRARCRASECFS
jgi:hypothetical protein